MVLAREATIFFFLAITLPSILASFPNSDSPYEAGLPLASVSSNCSVVLFDNVSLVNYGQVETSTFDGPCMDEWSSVVLEFQGSVRGVQFDRAGCVWLDGVELLRTTTPEPTTAGIDWFIARELNQYSSLFRKSTGKDATLQIPNTVDSTYTGALDITVKLTFVSTATHSQESKDASKDSDSNSDSWDDVIALAPPTLSSNPWGSMNRAGNASLSASYTSNRIDIIGARLDVYASGHGCEEVTHNSILSVYVFKKVFFFFFFVL
jgi:hypothetical protein